MQINEIQGSNIKWRAINSYAVAGIADDKDKSLIKINIKERRT